MNVKKPWRTLEDGPCHSNSVPALLALTNGRRKLHSAEWNEQKVRIHWFRFRLRDAIKPDDEKYLPLGANKFAPRSTKNLARLRRYFSGMFSAVTCRRFVLKGGEEKSQGGAFDIHQPTPPLQPGRTRFGAGESASGFR
jgi:hypothetical protein